MNRSAVHDLRLQGVGMSLCTVRNPGAARLLVAAASLVAFLSTNARAVTVLESVNWTQQEPAPTALLGGSWSFGTLTGTTGATHNAGQVFPANWGGLPFGVGYTTSINEGVALGVTTGTQQQTFSFSAPISSLYLFFNYTDADTSFDFGNYNWTLVGANNAYRSGSSVVIEPTTGDSEQDGFLININESFGPGNDLVFNFVNSGVSGYQTVAFNLGQGVAVVPEPSTYAMALVGLTSGGFSMWRRRKRA